MAAITTLTLHLILGCVLPQNGKPTGDWEALFNGKNYAGFTFWIPGGPENTFFVENGCMVFRGKTNGFTYTRKKYRNYELSYQWRYERPRDLKDDATFQGNSGVFIHQSRILLKDDATFQGNRGVFSHQSRVTKPWAQCIEVEGKYTDMGKLMIHGKTKVIGELADYPEARKAATKPVGEWNTTLVHVNEGKVRITINGKVVSEGAIEEKEGAIGFQAQGTEVWYRNIHLREMK